MESAQEFAPLFRDLSQSDFFLIKPLLTDHLLGKKFSKVSNM